MSNLKFKEYKGLDLSRINEDILKQWDADDTFHRSIETREGHPTFVFYEGPPSANGKPGIHHVMARTIKDIICRFKTQQGYLVHRKAGWDTHGLPVELGVEKSLGITKEDIGKSISVADYNAACRRDVMKYTQEWTDLTQKMGYWVDLENPYITYDNRYIETLWYLLKELYKKGLLYKGYTIQPYSPAAGTGLSSHELNQPGCYRDVKDTTCTAQFRILDPKPEMAQFGDPFFLAWTTTPWTLPSNTALCVGPNFTYVAVQTYNPYTGMPMTAVLAKDLVHVYFNPKAADLELSDYKPGDKLIPFKIVGEWQGPELAGMRYEQLIPWVNPGEGAFRVITGDYVTVDDGTGIVHIAPTFGADDDRVAKVAGIPPLMLVDKDGNRRPMVDMTGKFFLLEDLDPEYVQTYMNAADYDPWQGQFVKNAYDPTKTDKDETLDIEICMMLKAQNRVFKIEKHVHNYPHCWRTDKPVLYYPLDSWFIRTTACRERMIELNNTINWKPQSTGSGRFGKWLENLQDWNLSRSRYWGTPLPIWRTEDGTEEICIGSVEELYNEVEKAVEAGFMESNPYKDLHFVPGEYTKENYDKIDLHRPYVDDIILVSKSGKPMKREADLIDVWFDSGAMPYAQIHYPFENKEAFDERKIYPADFIAEGVDQTRGWFFTLHAIATMVFDSVAYKAVVSNGLVLDKNGNKMSKRLGNAIDPFATIEQYGSDPLRWYMITNASPWDNIKFDIDGIEEVRRKFFGTLYNTYSFFALYANVDGFTYSEPDVAWEERPEIDRWILSELNTLVKNVTDCFDDYDPTKAGRLIETFVIDNLSNWYVRLNRKRFWAGQMGTDKLSAHQTLYTCLLTVSKLMAPIAPFYADRLYKDLTECMADAAAESVHLTFFPEAEETMVDGNLEERMRMAQKITSMVLSLRKKEKIIVRQPLQRISIPVSDDRQRAKIEAVKQLILDEVNVKSLEFVNGALLEKKVKCNFRVMGKKFGKLMKAVSAAVAEMSQASIAELEQNGSVTLRAGSEDVLIERDDVEIISEDIPGWTVANDGTLTVALDLEISDELRQEGLARELIKRIQAYRKESGFEITDHICVTMEASHVLQPVVDAYRDYICGQVLADSFTFAESDVVGTTFSFDDFNVKVNIQKSTL